MTRASIFIVTAVMAVLCTACGSAPGPGETQAAEAKAPPAQETRVTLTRAAQAEARIEVAEAKQEAIAVTVSATGPIVMNENRTWRAGSITEGRVVHVYASVGDRVTKGQVLARMHSHDIHESRALYRKALAELDRLRAEEAFRRRVRDRMSRLLELKAASLEQRDMAETEWNNAKIAVSNAEIEVERTRSHLVDYLQIPADHTRSHREGDPASDEDLIPVFAPESGVVVHRYVTQGTVVSPGAEMFVISNLGTLWMLGAVNEESLSKLRPGMGARVSVQAYPDRTFSGRIERLEEGLNPTTRTVTVRVSIANAGGLLRPEMYARAEIDVGDAGRALFIPQEAVQQVSGASVVFVKLDEELFEARPVRTGRVLNGMLEVISGIRPGETVATRGSFILKSQLMRSALEGE